MSTIKEMQYEIGKKILEVKEEGVKSLHEKLKELNLCGLVRRKQDGIIGELRIWDYNDLRFYPLKKNGLKSEKASGIVWKVEEEFEPANEKGG